MTKDAYYFSHDSNARNDLKIKAMRTVYEGKGYGWYWILIEMMREQGDYQLPYNGKYSAKIYAGEFGCTEEEAIQFIDDCINEFKLLKTDGKCIWSESLMRRMEKREEIRGRRQEAGRKGGLAKAKQKESKCLAGKERKGKEIKEKKERKEREYAPTVKMAEEEYTDLCGRFGKKKIDTYIEKISDWQKSKGKRHKDMPATIKNWMRRDAGVDSVTELEVKNIPKCLKCNKLLENEIRNSASSCYGCGTKI